jgi:iron complex outermembrane receptor protein
LRRRLASRLATALAVSASTGSALAQRAAENAVTQAVDAFGISLGREEIGLYSSSDVRGFSPIDAGNARIEGLYFDPFFQPPARIRASTTIRVGLAAQGLPLPAPTGVVDYALRRPGDEAQLSSVVYANELGRQGIEIDGAAPLVPGVLGIAGGITVGEDAFFNGTDASRHNEGVSLHWTPKPGLRVVPFWARSVVRDDEAGPIYLTADGRPPGALPPERRFDGPDWAFYSGRGTIFGTVVEAALSPRWALKAGAFDSSFADRRSSTQLALDVDDQGRYRQLAFIDPPSAYRSRSGELRLTRALIGDDVAHRLHVSLRAKHRRLRYDGAAVIDLGARRWGERIDLPEPDFIFGPQSTEAIRQTALGAAWETQWASGAQVGFGVQRVEDEKRVARPDTGAGETRSTPTLGYLNGAWQWNPRVVIYGSATQGLEESGIAPANAVNRGQPAPAIRTRQFEAGVRWQARPTLTLIAGAFQLEKPYFSLDAGNRFAALGDIATRGVELSLVGALHPRLNLVAGAVLADPRVEGPEVDAGAIGRDPVRFPRRQALLSLDWRVPGVEGLSLDTGLEHRGRIAATTDNRVRLPSITTLALGGRYAFDWSGRDASLRVGIDNALDRVFYELEGPGAYSVRSGRTAEMVLSVDW